MADLNPKKMPVRIILDHPLAIEEKKLGLEWGKQQYICTKAAYHKESLIDINAAHK